MSSISKNNDNMEADITLVLEGSYPYVRGGVSSWVNQIINGLPDLKFSILFLGTQKDHYKQLRYQMPKNVTGMTNIYMFKNTAFKPSKKHYVKEKTNKILEKIFEHIKPQKDPNLSYLNELYNLYCDTSEFRNLSDRNFYNSYQSWNLITDTYKRYSKEASFLNYIWNLRAILGPILQILKKLNAIPKTKTIHTISTGYAGFCATLLSKIWNVPLVLTEHGIYNKERKIDIFKTKWLYEGKSSGLTDVIRSDGGYLKDMWIQSFARLSKYTYDNSSAIVTLYKGNQILQIKDGANKDKMKIIPNGISTSRFSNLIEKRNQICPQIIGLIGRVVSIKDIKTFILSILEIRNKIPDIQGWVIGPEEEEPEYVQECKKLIENLGIENNFFFKGFQKVEDIYPKLGICALTSISEGQPLVILEAFAAGVPCVTTDVGCCKELIYGAKKKDKEIGAAGRVVPISNPNAFAKAAIELLNSENNWKRAQNAGIKRVNNYYTEKMMIEQYKNLYNKIINNGWNRFYN